MPEKKHKFDNQIEDQVAKIIIDGEYTTARSNKHKENDDFEAYVNMLDASERREKNYDWQSDIVIPEFLIIMLTQSANDVSQYFKTREFVEVYIEDEKEKTLKAAESQKECINRTLNQKHLQFYPKFVRAKLLNNLQGRVYLRCWWEQETRSQQIGIKKRVEILNIDRYGRPMVDYATQIPAVREIEEPVMVDVAVIDRFNFDVIDPRNVFTDPSYTYSLQDKKWVIIRDEPTLEELKADREREGYFNLDLLDKDKISQTEDTETAQETYNKENPWAVFNLPRNATIDRLRRYGKFWCIVKKRDETGFPIEIEPGIDDEGNVKKNAVLLETIITYIVKNNTKLLIGFYPTPYMDTQDNPYRPIIRGFCYIHPTKDGGTGDAIMARELQIAINDSVNVSQDRAMLAAIPFFKGKRQYSEEISQLDIRPGGIEFFDNPTEDLQELKISDNILASNSLAQFYISEMQKGAAIFPSTMGGLPSISSTTATAIAGAESRTDVRSNYKSFSFEYTVLSDLYWMIAQMTHRFAQEETGLKLMGEKLYDFNPELDYTYKPLSQSIESEYSKANKLKNLITLYGYTAQIQHPDTVKLVNKMLANIYTLFGDEYVQYAKALLNPEVPIMQGGGQGGQTTGVQTTPVSNQNNIPQSMIEQGTRDYGIANA